MKKIYIILLSVIVATACATSQAGTRSTGSQQSTVLSANHITSFSTSLPVEVVISDSSSPRASIEIPSAEIAQWVVCELRGSDLAIYARKNAGRKLDALSSKNPIKVRIESSEIGEIYNTSSARITCHNKRFANSLSISNTGALHISTDGIDLNRSFDVSNSGAMSIVTDKVDLGEHFYLGNTGRIDLDAKRIKAADKVTLSNAGRITGTTQSFECRIWDQSNTGVVELTSHITSDKVICTSTGCDKLSLDIECKNLEVASTGSGNMKFTGSADNISVTSIGSARISTSELRQR